MDQEKRRFTAREVLRGDYSQTLCFILDELIIQGFPNSDDLVSSLTAHTAAVKSDKVEFFIHVDFPKFSIGLICEEDHLNYYPFVHGLQLWDCFTSQPMALEWDTNL